MNKKKRRRPIHLHVMVSEEELALIRERMAEAGVRNLGAYVRKMALNGYVLHVDLSDVRELVSLQRRCSNNLNQVAIPRRIPTAAFTRRRSRRCSGTMKPCGSRCPICSKSCRRWWSFNPCRGAPSSPAAPASGHFVQRWAQKIGTRRRAAALRFVPAFLHRT